MYGQKQILQCLFVILLVSILNFYRTIIRREMEMQKYRNERPVKAIRKADETVKVDLPIVRRDESQDEALVGLMCDAEESCLDQPDLECAIGCPFIMQPQCDAANRSIGQFNFARIQIDL